MTTPKKAAPRLGPDAPAVSSQPPWAMVSANGSDLYFPTKQEDALAFAREFGAQPVDPSGFPWPSILNEDGKIEIADAGAAAPDALSAPEGEQGGPVDTDAVPTPPATAQPARRAKRKAPTDADLLGYCPTPEMCFPLGLPDDCSHVACIHGSSS